jgi:hypothetical protein
MICKEAHFYLRPPIGMQYLILFRLEEASHLV